MRVTTFVASLNTVNLDRCRNGRAADLVLIQNALALEIAEPSPDLEPEIPDHKLNSRVSRIKMPNTWCHCRFPIADCQFRNAEFRNKSAIDNWQCPFTRTSAPSTDRLLSPVAPAHSTQT